MENRSIGFRPSPQQKCILSRGQKDSSHRAACVVRIEGKLDSNRLREACKAVVRRHEILRTTFQCPPGVRVPYQVVETEAGAVAQFSLSAGDAGLNFLSVAVPSLCADAATLRNLVREIFDLYSGHVQNEETPLQYADFSEWQNELLEGEDPALQAAKDYWSELGFSSLTVPVLPLEMRGVRSVSSEPETVEAQIGAGLAADVTRSAREQKSSVSDFLLACWLSLLWRLGEQADIPVLEVVDGRNRAELKRAMGVFARPLPVRISFGEEPAFAEVLRRVREATSEAAPYSDHLTPEEFFPPGSEAAALPVGFEFAERMPKLLGDGLSFSVERLSAPLYPFKVKLACEWGEDAGTVRFEHHPQLW